jgi:hypothetical protein
VPINCPPKVSYYPLRAVLISHKHGGLCCTVEVRIQGQGIYVLDGGFWRHSWSYWQIPRHCLFGGLCSIPSDRAPAVQPRQLNVPCKSSPETAFPLTYHKSFTEGHFVSCKPGEGTRMTLTWPLPWRDSWRDVLMALAGLEKCFWMIMRPLAVFWTGKILALVIQISTLLCFYFLLFLAKYRSTGRLHHYTHTHVQWTHLRSSFDIFNKKKISLC